MLYRVGEKVLPANGIYRLLLECFITWKFENMHFRAIIVVALATRYTTSVRHYWAITWKKTLATEESNNNVCITC